MTRGPLSFRRTIDAQLVSLFAAQSKLDVTYHVIGMTGQGDPVDDYRAVSGAVELGQGRDVFDRAVRGLQTWKVHERSGLQVIPKDAGVRAGTSVVFQTRIGLLYVTIACRVVSIINADDQWGSSTGRFPTTWSGARNHFWWSSEAMGASFSP